MKVALVTNAFPSLSESFIYNKAAGLQAAGLDITVIATRPSTDAPLFSGDDAPRFDGAVVQATFSDGARRTAQHLLGGSTRDVALWRSVQGLYGPSKRAARAWMLAQPCVGFDIVHFELSGLAVTWLDALPLLAPSRIVVSCRGSAERITPLVEPARAVALRSVFALAARVHCVSEDMLRTCASYGLDPARAFINRPAVDVARFQRRTPYDARSNGPYRLVSTGRLHWAKGIEYALAAVRALVDADYDVRYELIGAGPAEQELRFTVHDLGLGDRVTFSGSRPPGEVRGSLERCDAFLLPSVSEGISNAALEAMAMGIPVVSTTTGGMPEAITDGVDGRLVRPRDPAAIAAAVGELLDDAPSRAAIGRAAAIRVARDFTIERQLRVFKAEYVALVG